MSKLDQIRALREAKAARRPLATSIRPRAARVERDLTLATVSVRVVDDPVAEGLRKMGRPKGPKTVPLPVRIPPGLLAKIDAEASKRGVPRNGLVTSILAEAMAK